MTEPTPPAQAPEPTEEQRAERAIRANRATRGALAAVLGLEALVVLLVPRAIAFTSTGLGGTRAGLLIALAVVMVVAAGLMRRPWGIGLGSVLQVPFILTGIWLTAMFVVAAIFATIWLSLLNLRRELVGTARAGPDARLLTTGLVPAGEFRSGAQTHARALSSSAGRRSTAVLLRLASARLDHRTYATDSRRGTLEGDDVGVDNRAEIGPGEVEWLDLGPAEPTDGTGPQRRSRRPWYLLAAAIAVAVILVAALNHGTKRKTASPSRPPPASATDTTAPSSAEVSPTASATSSASVAVTNVGHRLLDVPPGWELFGRGS